MGSPKQKAIDLKIMHLLSGTSLQAAKWLMQDKEIQYLQDYANTVSIKRECGTSSSF